MMMRILVLEDDDLVAAALQDALQREGYQVHAASSAAQAVAHAREHVFDLIICDVRMPDVDGLEALQSLRQMQSGVRGIVITGYASSDAPVRAIKNRVDDYLFKPFSVNDLLRAVRYSLALAESERQAAEAVETLRCRYLAFVATLVAAFQDQDPMFFEHSRRVASLAVDMGRELGLAAERLDQLELAALLHDVGLSYIDREILHKADALVAEEARKLREHPVHARNLLALAPDLRDVLPILTHQRERFDGSGYPHGLRGEAIPIESRILAVAEAYDSLTHERPHRTARSCTEALAELRACSPSQFDAAVVEVCGNLAEEARVLTNPAELLRRSGAARASSRNFTTLMQLGNLSRDAGDAAAAAEAYAAAADVAPSGAYWRSWLQAEQCLLAVRAAQPQAAVDLAKSARSTLEQVTEKGSRAWLLVLLSRGYVEMGQVDQARAALQEAVQLYEENGEVHAAVTARASLAATLRNHAGFAEALQSWLQGITATYLDSLTAAEARSAVAILAHTVQHSGATAAVEEALSHLARLWPPLLQPHLQSIDAADAALARRLSEPVHTLAEVAPRTAERPLLEVQLFGPLQVRIQERTVPPAAWSTRKARELFAFLMVQGRPVPFGRLVEMLWPESADRRTLHKTAQRVRQALRHVGDGPILVTERDFYSIEGPRWCDFEQFEKLCASIGLDVEGALQEAELMACQRALDVYRGDFLEGTEEAWVEMTRTAAREKWMRVLGRLAHHHAALQQWDSGMSCYGRMLEADPCREEAWLGLVRSHHARGEREAAVRTWQDYRAVLAKELALEPSTEASRWFAAVISQ